MAKQWRIHPHDPARIVALERAAAIPAVVAQLLLCRGIHDPSRARAFLDAPLNQLRDPDELPGLAAAADRITAAIAAGRRIVIYGDYDVDGMSATSILFQCLKMLSAEVSYYVPNRIDEGYGLHCDALETLAAGGAQVIVTVDCGAGSVVEARKARELGLELIITDHHNFKHELPEADCIVHPALPGTAYPFTGLCGAGVAFKLAWGLCQRASQSKKVGERMRNFLLQAVGLVSLGTVADVVPLVDENRVLVRHGLVKLRERPTLGVAALCGLVGLDLRSPLGSEDISFKLAPRLNAAGRLGQATLGVELLTTDSTERAGALAAYLHELNGSRESLERSIYLAANKQAAEQFDPEGDAALVLAGRGWHPGVIGIVAARLAEKFNRPVVLVALDPVGVKPGVGSARSACGFNLHAGFEACSEHLVSHGGHAAAAGLKIAEDRLDAFRAQFCEIASGEMSAERRVAELRIDAEVPFSALTNAAVCDIERLAPFGHANPRPLLCTSNVTLSAPPKPVGGGERHLSLRLAQHGVQFKAIAFGGGEWAVALQETPGPIAVAFRPFVNQFRGRKSVELEVCDWQPAAALAKTELCAYGATRAFARDCSLGRAMLDDVQFALARHDMIRQLEQRGNASRRVLEAMARVPRERFMPADVRHLAYADRALPIECEQTISQPYIVALMTDALQLTGGERVLDVGTGSGYQAAILAELAASVVTIERHEQLARSAEQVLADLGYRNVTVVIGDGTHGWPERAPYDAILVAAAAVQVPQALEAQLAEGGTLVIPVGAREGQVLTAYRKLGGQLRPELLSGCRFVPLVGAQERDA